MTEALMFGAFGLGAFVGWALATTAAKADDERGDRP